MVDYVKLGFKTFDNYFDTFMGNLLSTNKTYDYFVDWKKVRQFVVKYKPQIFLLNSLRGAENKEELNEEFVKLLLKYPEVVEVIPLLIAERVNGGKIDILDPELGEFIIYEFRKRDLNREEAAKIAYFCDRVGIFNLIIEVKDLYDYLLGVEVGIDTNARKNRSGEIFERLVELSLRKNLPENYKLIPQDPNFSLYKTIGKSKREQAKKHDFVLYFENTPKFVVEVNFYNVSGSKPISIAESYVALSSEAKKLGTTFVWITDGPAWHKMIEPLKRAMDKIDFIINYNMIPLFCSVLSSL